MCFSLVKDEEKSTKQSILIDLSDGEKEKGGEGVLAFGCELMYSY